jgi:diphthamide synthase (EF-2-diphthine--ammonia ligase)
LAYLWQRDQAELLNEMVEAGMEAILIKVAGIGLTPQHLGKTLAQMQPHLTKLVSWDFDLFPSCSHIVTERSVWLPCLW